MDCLLINENFSVFLRNQHVTQNRLSFAGSQTLLASENELNSTGNFNSTETVGDARRLLFFLLPVIQREKIRKLKKKSFYHYCAYWKLLQMNRNIVRFRFFCRIVTIIAFTWQPFNICMCLGN